MAVVEGPFRHIVAIEQDNEPVLLMRVELSEAVSRSQVIEHPTSTTTLWQQWVVRICKSPFSSGDIKYLEVFGTRLQEEFFMQSPCHDYGRSTYHDYPTSHSTAPDFSKITFNVTNGIVQSSAGNESDGCPQGFNTLSYSSIERAASQYYVLTSVSLNTPYPVSDFVAKGWNMSGVPSHAIIIFTRRLAPNRLWGDVYA